MVLGAFWALVRMGAVRPNNKQERGMHLDVLLMVKILQDLAKKLSELWYIV